MAFLPNKASQTELFFRMIDEDLLWWNAFDLTAPILQNKLLVGVNHYNWNIKVRQLKEEVSMLAI